MCSVCTRTDITCNSPGRYYAAAFMKVVVGQIIMNYDLKLVEPGAPRWMTWRAAMLPLGKTMVMFTPRGA